MNNERNLTHERFSVFTTTLDQHAVLFATIGCAGSAGAPSKAPAPQAQPKLSKTVASQDRAVSAPAPAMPSSKAEPQAAPGEPTASAVPAAPKPPAPRCPEGMVLVEGGQFKSAGKSKATMIADLCVDILETTTAEYKKCVEAGDCTTSGVGCSAQSTWEKPGKENHPMVCPEFNQANTYCGFKGKRLPTTFEWGWVARGGEEARKYPWGNEEPNDQLCWTGKKRRTEKWAAFQPGQAKMGS